MDKDMKPKSDRQRMIDELIHHSFTDDIWKCESWKAHILLHGLKGFDLMTDEEIIAEHNEMKDEQNGNL